MRNIKLTIEYDGTAFSGWQRQSNRPSVEQTVDTALRELLKENIKLLGSSRTDAGVHAKGQVANFRTESSIPAYRFVGALNGMLPPSVVIVDAEEVPFSFHSRYDSHGKVYSYTILNRKIRPAYMNNYVAFVHYDLDFERMKKASESILGTHDFAAFKSKGGSVKTTVRTIKSLELVRTNDIIKMTIDGDGFLYNMVRIIAGTLVDIGRGRLAPDSMPDIIESRDRERAGKTASASGLCLEKIYYE